MELVLLAFALHFFGKLISSRFICCQKSIRFQMCSLIDAKKYVCVKTMITVGCYKNWRSLSVSLQ